MLIKSHIAGTVSAGEVKCSFSLDFVWFFSCAVLLKFEMHFDKLCRNSKFFAAEVCGAEQIGRDSSCSVTLFYARPDQEPHTRSEWYPVFIILFFLLCFSSLFFFKLVFHVH